MNSAFQSLESLEPICLRQNPAETLSITATDKEIITSDEVLFSLLDPQGALGVIFVFLKQKLWTQDQVKKKKKKYILYFFGNAALILCKKYRADEQSLILRLPAETLKVSYPR